MATSLKGSGGRLAIFARDAVARGWIEAELANQGYEREIAATVRELVYLLVAEGPQRPQVLIADLDGMSAADVLELHSIRERGWFGSIIALGTVAQDLRTSLNIEHVLARPLQGGALRKALAKIGLDRPTTKIPKLDP